MNNRRLLSITVLYGVADVIVMAVGGFLLLPLYTRSLSQEAFGTYIIVRANTEIFSYLLFFGLPSAVARVYFDYRKQSQHIEYMNSVLSFFLLNLLVIGLVLYGWGPDLWHLLSPNTPTDPFLLFSVALAAAGFMPAVGSLWLRLEGRASAFAGMQVATSVVLAAGAVLALTVWQMGLNGLLSALLLSSLCAGLVLPLLLGRRIRLRIHWPHVRESMRYAGPILVGYVAYFVLNRISTLVLQRHVAVDQIAIFGLSQQLAMMVTVAGAAFGKAQQPAVFAAEAADAVPMLVRSGTLMRRLMLLVTGLLVLGAPDLLRVVAPASYGAGVDLLLILLFANFAYAFSLVSDTALLYHRRPKTSVSVSLVGACLSASLSLLLVPQWQLMGAAVAIAGTFVAMSFLSHWLSWRITGYQSFVPMSLSLAGVGAVALWTAWLVRLDLPAGLTLGLKLLTLAGFGAVVYLETIRKPAVKTCAH